MALPTSLLILLSLCTLAVCVFLVTSAPMGPGAVGVVCSS